MGTISLKSRLGRNIIINPLFDMWQRNITFNPIPNGTYFADRFLVSDILVKVFCFINGAGVATHSGHGVQWVADAEL